MARVAPILESMNGGEYTPLLEGRTDFAKYKKGLKLCSRFIPLVQGPITKCPGTYFISEVKDSSKTTRLVPFEFSTTQAYMLEFGDQYIRFYRNRAPITATAQNISAITKANPAVLTYAGADTYANGDKLLTSGIGGMVEMNNREITVANVNTGANTFEASGVDSTSYTTYTSGGTVAEIYEISSPYLEADLGKINFTQSADVLYITCRGYAPRKLTRTGHTSWTLSAIDFQDGPYLPTNTTSTTLTPGAATGTGVTLTASATTGINGGAGFASTDVGRLIRIKQGTIWGWVKIVGYTSTTVVTVDIQRTLTSTAAKTDWRMGVWSATTGYPEVVTFFGDRLFLGGPSSYPQRVDGSVVGDYETFAPSTFAAGSTTDNTTVTDDSAVSYTLNSNTVNAISGMMDDEKGLVIFTAKGEWILRASSQGEALTPTNVQATRSTTHGSKAFVAPIRAGKAIMFTQRAGRKIRELAYVYEDDGFKAPDMTVQANHITRTGVAEMAYQSEPQSIVWARREDGLLIGFSYEREQENLAWHRHPLGGTLAKVKSIAVIPNPAGDAEDLWMIVSRTIDGGTKQYVEYMKAIFWEEEDDQDDAFFVDGGLTYDSTSVTTITGLWHLRGQTVRLLADGATHPNVTVSATGSITMNRAASTVHIGLPYVANAITERIEAGSQNGTAQGKIKRIHKLIIRFLRSLGVSLGPDADHLDTIPFRTSNDDMGDAVPLFTGDKDRQFGGSYEKEGRIYIRSDSAHPCTVLCVMPQMETNDD